MERTHAPDRACAHQLERITDRFWESESPTVATMNYESLFIATCDGARLRVEITTFEVADEAEANGVGTCSVFDTASYSWLPLVSRCGTNLEAVASDPADLPTNFAIDESNLLREALIILGSDPSSIPAHPDIRDRIGYAAPRVVSGALIPFVVSLSRNPDLLS